MDLNSLSDREFWEEVLKRAEPYPEDDPVWNEFGGSVIDENFDMDRAFATLAKKALEGRL